jgi:hypothetical protein
MNNLEKIADELIECYWTEVEEIVNDECVKMTFNMAVQCAIKSVNYAIEVLEELSEKTKIQDMYEENICDSLAEQLELKKILEQKY